VRQRVTRELLGRRGRKSDPAWANRRLLLRGRERLSPAALARMWNGCIDHDPRGAILSAWIAKEELRALCATAATGGHREDIARRLWAFYTWCAYAEIPELSTLAETIETWWPAVGSYSVGVSAGGSQAPVVKSWRRASSLSSPHLVAVSR
jgi:transposase